MQNYRNRSDEKWFVQFFSHAKTKKYSYRNQVPYYCTFFKIKVESLNIGLGMHPWFFNKRTLFFIAKIAFFLLPKIPIFFCIYRVAPNSTPDRELNSEPKKAPMAMRIFVFFEKARGTGLGSALRYLVRASIIPLMAAAGGGGREAKRVGVAIFAPSNS